VENNKNLVSAVRKIKEHWFFMSARKKTHMQLVPGAFKRPILEYLYNNRTSDYTDINDSA